MANDRTTVMHRRHTIIARKSGNAWEGRAFRGKAPATQVRTAATSDDVVTQVCADLDQEAARERASRGVDGYGVQYEGTDVERLSPGTRGIVLLLLYLAIDLDDSRPLLIDQPEENLDPKSIFEELVARFRSAKQRRQIIIVTHNANLIVNADADQVIVAACGPHRPGELPEISYISGSLENPDIRARVCDILEGGEHAFKERAKRLRVRI